MKNSKKLISLLLVVVMMLSVVSVAAFAANPPSVTGSTVIDVTGHTGGVTGNTVSDGDISLPDDVVSQIQALEDPAREGMNLGFNIFKWLNDFIEKLSESFGGFAERFSPVLNKVIDAFKR